MKKFLVTQKFAGSAEQVTAAFRGQETWQSFADLPFVGTPVVQSFQAGDSVNDDVRIDMAYRVDIDLPSVAKKFIEPAKMTFVERTKLAADGSGSFEIIPDHYQKLIKASGRIEMVPYGDDSCERLIQGSIDVSLGWSGVLFEGPVEDMIVTGFKQALVAQAEQVDL